MTSGRDSVSTACVLAGGRGLRLRAVVADRPKPLADVAGRPFVTRLLDQLVRAKVERAVLCTGYLAAKVEEALGAEHAGLELQYSVEKRPLGTAGALRLALPEILASTVLVLNGDSYCDADLASFRQDHEASGASASLVLVETPDASRYGRVRVDSDGWIEHFEEKVEGSGPGLINAGIYLLQREVIEAIPASTSMSIERQVFPSLIGHGLRGFRSAGRFLDIGTPDSLARAADFFGGESA